MDIETYLRRTIPEVCDPDLTSEQPLLQWMSDSLVQFDLKAPFEVVPISTSDCSHRHIRMGAHHYLVWDIGLNATLWRLLVGLQFERAAIGLGDDPRSKQLRDIASSVFRHTMFAYLARKLARYPNISAAFGRLAEEHPPQDVLQVPEGKLIAELFGMQRLLMFYHEGTHAIVAERDDLRVRSKQALMELIRRLPEMLIPEEVLGPEFERNFPEFTQLDNDRRFAHFAEELHCDMQAFMIAAFALHDAPDIPARAWQDSIGMLFGASVMLASLERMLKLATCKWTEFARESSDGKQLTRAAIQLSEYLNERPLFFVRRWNTDTALTLLLGRMEKQDIPEAFTWQEYVMNKMDGMSEALDEYLIRELNTLATREFLAKVFARAKVHASGTDRPQSIGGHGDLTDT